MIRPPDGETLTIIPRAQSSQETGVTRSSKLFATPLPERIARARTEGRTQQALDLARQLLKQSPSSEHQELVREVTLERGAQLQQQGHTRDAAVLYRNALNLPGPPEFRTALVERLAACGDAARAMQMLGPDTDLYTRFSRN